MRKIARESRRRAKWCLTRKWILNVAELGCRSAMRFGIRNNILPPEARNDVFKFVALFWSTFVHKLINLRPFLIDVLSFERQNGLRRQFLLLFRDERAAKPAIHDFRRGMRAAKSFSATKVTL